MELGFTPLLTFLEGGGFGGGPFFLLSVCLSLRLFVSAFVCLSVQHYISTGVSASSVIPERRARQIFLFFLFFFDEREARDKIFFLEKLNEYNSKLDQNK